MCGEFFRFELRYWLRGWMIYIFVMATTVMFGFVAGSDFVTLGSPAGNTHSNSPYMIALWHASGGLLTCFMAAAIYDSSASRDFSSKMSDLLFSKPLNKWGFLAGRFLGATIIAVLPAFGVSLGILVAQAFTSWDSERWGPVLLWHHWQPILWFAIPNTLVFGSVVFAVASVTRNTLYSFLAVLVLWVTYTLSQFVDGSLEYENFASLIDPFGLSSFGVATKYWTVADRNSLPIPLTGMFIANRVLWIGISIAIFAIAGWLFTFETRARGRAKASKESTEDSDAKPILNPSKSLPIRIPAPTWVSQWASVVRSDLRAIVGSSTFIVILGFCLFLISINLLLNDTMDFGNSSFPVTYNMVEQILGSLIILPVALTTYFTGVLVWRDRDSKIHEIIGATPTPNSVFVLSRLATITILLVSILVGAIAVGCLYQWIHGYTRFQLGVYVTLLLGLLLASLLFQTVLGFVAHTVAPNKYSGYAFLVLFLILNAQVWRLLRWESLLLRFGAMPDYTYSDFFGIAPYLQGRLWFGAYWGAISIVLIWCCTIWMPRGVISSWRSRFKESWNSLQPTDWIIPGVAGISAVTIGLWLGYNTMVLNTLIGSEESEDRRVEYEQKYQKLEAIPQPRIQSIQYAIDIYPETRNMVMKGTQIIANKSDQPIDTYYINVMPNYDTKIEIQGASLQEDDERLSMRTYKLESPMQPGESREMLFTVKSKTRGIENEVTDPTLLQNGTFFNNSVAPAFGFSSERILTNPKRRRAKGLGEIEPLPLLTRECGDVCKNHYIAEDSDWVSIESIISTSADQIAVGPGSMVKSWTENGRNYYQYKVDHPSLNFYSFISARYEVKRSRVGDVETEVYYHKEHPWNVDRMSKAIGDTLEYCSKNFGPYKHRQARIIEFPRIASFAQAFPGTMPYAESVGFIANLQKPDDIDMVTYIVAHEMGHQWWVHQVIGARMQGATLLSETLAQYTALMIMRKNYGDDTMHKFLRFEMDRYLRARGSEQRKERPLMAVEFDQGYIHYQKGGIALYYLAEMIGEDRVNAALKSIIENYAYKGPPYPNAYALLDRLREQTPPELHYLIRDLFEEITLFGNRTTKANATKTDDGKYRVQISVECKKFKADAEGAETEVDMDDFLEIGAFAKPEPGNRFGKLLFRKRLQLAHGTHELEFIVDEKPYQAGIDPRNLLIDRVPDDNLIKVTLE
jgi:ABC-2 type transport system permease protein